MNNSISFYTADDSFLSVPTSNSEFEYRVSKSGERKIHKCHERYGQTKKLKTDITFPYSMATVVNK